MKGPHSHDHSGPDHNVAECEICSLKKPFKMPDEIVHSIRKKELVIFAGAGVSTEGRMVYPRSFYEDIMSELGDPALQKLGFSALMSRYCAAKDRRTLLHRIKERLDYMKKFPEVYRMATRFHRELSTIYLIEEIVTTNWDDFFERECNATPIVTGQDFSIFSDVPGRKVFKIHGSINNYGSIVATSDDYRRCYRDLKSGIIGAKLKVLLTSKTVVFMGYSFEDEDFRRIVQLLYKETRHLLPRSFVVTLDENAETKLSSLGLKVTPIITDASFFLATLKERLVKDRLMIPDENFQGIYTALYHTVKEHDRLSEVDLRIYPEALFSLAYQDGLMHALEDILESRNSGEFSHAPHVAHLVTSYETLRRRKVHDRDYWNAAYVEGFRNGLVYLLSGKRERKGLPLFLLFGTGDIETFEDFSRRVKKAKSAHRSSSRYARRLTEEFHSKGLVAHHTAFV